MKAVTLCQMLSKHAEHIAFATITEGWCWQENIAYRASVSPNFNALIQNGDNLRDCDWLASSGL